MKPLIIVAAVLLALILGKTFLGKGDAETEGKGAGPGAKGGGGGAPKAMTVSSTVLKREVSEMQVFSSGTLAPNEEVELKSELSGRLVKLLINEGSGVSKGQLIAKIKDDDILAQLKKVRIEAELAKQTEARQKKLLEIEAISKEEYDISASRVNTLLADKELLEVQLAKTEIRAPFSGKIGLKYISEGAYITPATVIATLVQTNPMKLDFSVPEKYLSMIKNGTKISYEIDGDAKKYEARVIAIDPQIDQTLRMLKLRALTSNNGNLLPGMFTKVYLNLGSNDALMIPSETIVPVLGGKKVFIKKNGVATEVDIQTGLRNESMVEVVSGLYEGDTLITSAIMTLKPGTPVNTK